MITKYLVESMTGLHVGKASTSTLSAKMNAIGNGKNIVAEIMADKRDLEEGLSMLGRGQGEVVAVRTQFPHSSGKLVCYMRIYHMPLSLWNYGHPALIILFTSHLYVEHAKRHLGTRTSQEHL